MEKRHLGEGCQVSAQAIIYRVQTKGVKIKKMIKGISHITFIVQDIEKTTVFFEKIFNAEVVYDSGEKTYSLSRERFLLIGDLWIAIMEGNPLNEKTYNHVAFKIDAGDFETYKKRVEALGVEIKKPRSRIEAEGKSLYFYDYDNHLFELHTGTLKERLAGYGSQER